MDLIMMIVLAFVVLIVVIIAVVMALNRDLMNYTVSGVKSLKPAGNAAENALVIFSPGLSGAAKKAAGDIALQLQSKGYNVDLAGVRSANKVNPSDYDMVIVGGPMYFGKTSSSIEAYLKSLEISKDVNLGVFVTTGSTEFNEEDIKSLHKQVASLQGDVSKTVTKTLRSGDYTSEDIEDFISEFTD